MKTIAVVAALGTAIAIFVLRRLSRAQGATGRIQAPRPTTGYEFRIRVDRSPTDTIECAQPELQLVALQDGIRVSLRGNTAGQPLNQAERFVLTGSGYGSED